MNTIENEIDVCCPVFNAALWDGKTHEWVNKLFIRDAIPEIMHMPIPGTFKKAVTGLWETAQQVHADPPLDDFLMLCYDPSPWKGVVLLSVTKEVPGADHERLTGTFISKVFDGPYSSIPSFIKEMDAYLLVLNKKARQYYFYYTYCPKCAKKYGHNYIVIFAEIEK